MNEFLEGKNCFISVTVEEGKETTIKACFDGDGLTCNEFEEAIEESKKLYERALKEMKKRMNNGIEELIGKTLVSVKADDYSVLFVDNEGNKYELSHNQDCCESVTIDDICGDLNDLVGSPILKASEDTNIDLPPLPNSDDSYTWTFYNLATFKGYVTIKFYGTSNGYYSETADFYKINKDY